MLDNFRSKIRGVAIGIVGLIAIIFAFSGAGTLTLTRAGSAEVASVDDHIITEQDVAIKLQQIKTSILLENNGMSEEQLDEDILYPIAVEQLIGAKALFNHAANGSMAAAPKKLADLIINSELFQTEGEFDEDRYRYFIRNRGFTNAGYKQSIAEEIIRFQLLNGLRHSSFVTPRELDRLASLISQTRDYYYLKLPLATIEDLVDPSEPELTEYFEQNKTQFQSQETAIFEYIELSPDSLLAEYEISEEDVIKRFAEQKEDFNQPVFRRAAHILFDIGSDKLAREVRRQLSDGGDFPALAKKHSIDAGSSSIGGDLGFSDGSAFPEKFEQALSKLRVGQVSEPILTDAGVHLVKLLDVERTSYNIDSERERIVSTIRQERLDELLPEKLSLLGELSYNAESLVALGLELGLKAGVSEPLSRSGGVGLGAYPELVEAAFGDEVMVQKFASEVVSVGGDRYFVVKLKDHMLPEQKPFDLVRSDVFNIISEFKVEMILEQRRSEFMIQLEGGQTIEEIAKSAGLEWQVVFGAKRWDRELNAEVNRFVFDMIPDVHSVYGSFVSLDGQFYLVSLKQTNMGGSEGLNTEELKNLVSSSWLALSNREIQAYQSGVIEMSQVRK